MGSQRSFPRLRLLRLLDRAAARISKSTNSSRIVPSVIQGTAADTAGAKKSPHHIRVSSYPEFLNKFKLVAFCILWQTVFRNSTKRAIFGALKLEFNFA